MTDHKFALGVIVATPHALRRADDNRISISALLARHARGDWGDVGAEDWRSNDDALRLGERLLSSYGKGSDGHLWIITERDRSVTTVLCPEDY